LDRIVVIGTSSGGLEALRTLAAGLRPDFSAPICIVIHTAPDSPGVAHEIIGKVTLLKAVSARNMERLEAGKIYVAPPDCHLLVEPNRLRLTRGPKQNRFRPAIDPLFRTAARAFGPAAIGVILTGNLDDGTAGLSAIKQLGGIAIVQDPRDALFPSMPQSALFHVKADYCVPLDRIAAVLGHLTRQSVTATTPPISPELDTEVRIAKEEDPMEAGLERIAKPSRFACPDCHGVLLQFTDQNRIRFRCHTGHAYSIDSLLGAYSEQIETSLWNGIRSLEETALVLDALTKHVEVAHTGTDARPYAARALEARKDAARLRDIVSNRVPLVGEGQRGKSPELADK
jgi:two-component system, chemotaxis family, protein-glutamate methylesterase/glutaminase